MTNALIEANWHRTIDQIELADIAENMDAYAVIRVGPGWTVKLDGEQRSLYVERRFWRGKSQSSSGSTAWKSRLRLRFA